MPHIWWTYLLYLKTKEWINAEEFHKFIDGPTVAGFGLNALIKICTPIDLTLRNEQTPLLRLFS